MEKTLASPGRTAVGTPRPTASSDGRRRLARSPARVRDLHVIGALMLGFAALVVLTWRAWGQPETDPGVDLTTADLINDGWLPYADMRYTYGPAGVYALALAFRIFGASFTVAFGFGMVQAAAIVAAFYALARQWLRPVTAGLTTLVVMGLGLSGSLFNFVLPHTTSATFGLLFLLLELLALARRRLLLAGLAAGVVLLSRPEFAIAAVVAGGGYLLGLALDADRRTALRAARSFVLPALGVALAALGPFAVVAGPHRLFLENLVPVDFVRASASHYTADWAPFSAASGVATAARAAVYLGLLAGLVGSALAWSRRRSVLAMWPLAAALGGLLAVAVAAKALGAFPGTRGVVQTEVERRLIGTSWLPALAAGAAILAAWRANRGRRAPLSGSWALDLALIAAAVALGLRAYNKFTTDIYAVYYAPPLVLLAGILHERIADRWPAARGVALGALAFVGMIFAGSAVTGLSADETRLVRTPRGGFMAPAEGGANLQRVVDIIRVRTKPGDPVLALPLEGGIPFIADRPPALYDQQLVPGLLNSVADERRAIGRLERERVPLVIEATAPIKIGAWPLPVIGKDYNRVLLSYVHRRYRLLARIGDFDPRHDVLARAYRVYERRRPR